jgi:hypothetical protein
MAAEITLSKSGYLTKQGHRVKNWKRRYFTVENGLLTYFETAGDTKNLGQVRGVADHGWRGGAACHQLAARGGWCARTNCGRPLRFRRRALVVNGRHARDSRFDAFLSSHTPTPPRPQINIANCAIEIEPEDRFKRANVFVITAATGESLILQVRGFAASTKEKERAVGLRACGQPPRLSGAHEHPHAHAAHPCRPCPLSPPAGGRRD